MTYTQHSLLILSKATRATYSDDYSITISHLNYEGKRRTRNLEIPYEIDFETVKATYKNGILEVIFDRE
ncbi:MAG: Hsp20/alpha crystallin family protein [Nitrososphaeraceae archaeon]